jgi:hypothetical protein
VIEVDSRKWNYECHFDKFMSILKFMRVSILTVNYLVNKVLHKKIEKKTYELWKSNRPSYKYLGHLAEIVVFRDVHSLV